jgi:membrane-bound lytic murein transglycosylase A
MWVEARAPGATPEAPDVTLRRLFVAQDTGGAIRGPVRGDVYWGAGQEAESIAGRMAHKGKMFVLLPKPLAAKVN